MPRIQLRSFTEALRTDTHRLVAMVAELERIRNDARTTQLLVRARQFLGEVELYIERQKNEGVVR